MSPLKLNLGCGTRRKEGYVNVDKYGVPDVRHDLETFPWPWKDGSVREVVLTHVLEHLGERTEVFLKIMQELYRICEANAEIHLVVPHPRHDNFLSDPTHVRAITPDGLHLFSKSKNKEWARSGYANSPLGLYLDVDFEVVKTAYVLEGEWDRKRSAKEMTEQEIMRAVGMYNNVVKEIQMVLKVVK